MQTDLSSFLHDLSSAAPVPGGGAVAALDAAMGAALLCMVAELTLGRPRLEASHAAAREARDRAAWLRDRAVALSEEDAQAFALVSSAMKMPRASGAEKETRRVALQTALRGAATPPLETMRVAAAVLEVAGALVPVGNPAAISDVGVAALCARASFHAARLNVEINMAAVTDEAWVQETSEALAAMPDVDRAERTLVAQVTAAIRGDAA